MTCDALGVEWVDRIRGWLRREARDVREVLGDAERRLDADLSRRERALAATPEERLQATLDEIAASGESYERLRDDLEAGRRPSPE